MSNQENNALPVAFKTGAEAAKFANDASLNYSVVSYQFVVPEGTIHLPKEVEESKVAALIRAEYAVVDGEFRKVPLKWRKRLERFFKEHAYQVMGKTKVYLVPSKHMEEVEDLIQKAREAYQNWYDSEMPRLQEAIDGFVAGDPNLERMLAKGGIEITAQGLMSNCGFDSSQFSGGVRPQRLGKESDEEYAKFVSVQATERAKLVRNALSHKFEALVKGKTSLTKEGQDRVFAFVEELAEAKMFDESLAKDAQRGREFLAQFERARVKPEHFEEFVDGIRIVLGSKKVSSLN